MKETYGERVSFYIIAVDSKLDHANNRAQKMTSSDMRAGIIKEIREYEKKIPILEMENETLKLFTIIGVPTVYVLKDDGENYTILFNGTALTNPASYLLNPKTLDYVSK
jgi:hypothetical protein